MQKNKNMNNKPQVWKQVPAMYIFGRNLVPICVSPGGPAIKFFTFITQTQDFISSNNQQYNMKNIYSNNISTC